MLLDDVRAYLIAQGAVPTGFSIYEGYIPDDQDRVIALFETGGYPPTTMQRETETVTFQTRVRTARLDYPICRNLWQVVFNALQDSQINTNYFLMQAQHSGPMVFNDDKGRPNMTSNWRVIKARS